MKGADRLDRTESPLLEKNETVADFHGSLTKEMVSHSYLRATGLMKFFEMVERWIDTLGDAAVVSSWTIWRG